MKKVEKLLTCIRGENLERSEMMGFELKNLFAFQEFNL